MHDHETLSYIWPTQKYIHNIKNGYKNIIQDLMYIIHTIIATNKTS